MDGYRLSGKSDSICHVLQSIAGHHRDDRRAGGKPPFFAELLHSGRACHSRRFSEHSACAAENTLRRHDLLVRYIYRQSFGFTDGGKRLIRVARHPDSDGIGYRVLFHRSPGSILRYGAVQRAAACGLYRYQPGQTVYEAHGVKILQALPESGYRTAVPDRNRDIIRSPPVQLLHDLISYGLLSFRQIRVDGSVSVVPAPAVYRVAADLKGLFVAAHNRDNGRPKGKQLRDLSFRSPRRHENIGPHAGGGRIPGQGGGRVSRGRACYHLRAGLISLRHRHRGRAVLEGCRRIEPVVLYPKPAYPKLRRKPRLLIKRRPADSERRRGSVLLHRQQLTISPHGAFPAPHECLSCKITPDIFIVIFYVQDAAALAVCQIRHRFIRFAASDASCAENMLHHDVPPPKGLCARLSEHVRNHISISRKYARIS